MQKKYNFDLFVIGGGSGGVRAARVASSNGLKVGLAEGWDLGGTCVNRGCIPKKLYSFSSHFCEEMEIMKSFGWSVKSSKFDWTQLVKNKRKELLRLNKIYKDLLKKSGVTIFNEYASFQGKNFLKVGKKKISSKKFLIAVGTKPKKLKFSANDEIITSDDAFDLKELPKKILILGGGYIAVEFASIFNGLGVDTTVCIRGKKILKDFDDEISSILMEQMSFKGVKFITENFPNEISFSRNFFTVDFGRNNNFKYDLVFQALGREPNLDKLNIDNTKITRSSDGSIVVNDYFRTSKKNVYAIGDIINRIQLTPVAISEAMNLIDNFSRKNKIKFKYENIPTAVFSNPNLATVGLTEKQAKKKYKKIAVFKSNFKPLKHSLSDSKERVFIKLIVNSLNDKILGLHYVGENAPEIIQGFSVAVVNGLTKKQLDDTIGIHPTSAEEIVTLKK